MWIIASIAWLIGLGLIILVGMLGGECVASWLPPRKKEIANNLSEKIAILVPAHNEAVVIAATLQRLLSELSPLDKLLVIADNCSDETAKIARSLGVTVVERQDLTDRGKGYALDYGLQQLAEDSPDVVIVVDADCLVEPGSIKILAQEAIAHQRPIQATYLMQQPPQPTPKDAISALAFRVKNLVRPLGLKRLGMPCILAGTGMAFPWVALQQVGLASGNIVEDMQLGIDLAIAGYPPQYCPEAKVIGCLPQQQQAATQQRKRWEHGHLQTILTQVPRLLQASIQQKRFDLLVIALDLSIPPLSLLVGVWIFALGIAILAGWIGSSWYPTFLISIQGVIILISIVGSWAKYARSEIPAATLLAVPFYILWKIPLYFAFLIQPQKQWIRTKRDS